MENLRSIRGFCDVNIPCDSPQLDKILEKLIRYEYSVIALNWTVDLSVLEPTKKKKNSGSPDVVPCPNSLHKEILVKYGKKLKIFRRLTIIFKNLDQLSQATKSLNFVKYDVCAVLPVDQSAFQCACNTNEVNILSFEMGVTDYKPMRNLYKQATDRGAYFEIPYAQSLRSAVKRQETITMAQRLHIYGKSKNVIISSGAKCYLEVRNPFDVANLSLFFGLSEEQGRCCQSSNCKAMFLKAFGIKMGSTPVFVTDTAANKDKNEEPSAKKIKIG